MYWQYWYTILVYNCIRVLWTILGIVNNTRIRVLLSPSTSDPWKQSQTIFINNQILKFVDKTFLIDDILVVVSHFFACFFYNIISISFRTQRNRGKTEVDNVFQEVTIYLLSSQISVVPIAENPLKRRKIRRNDRKPHCKLRKPL